MLRSILLFLCTIVSISNITSQCSSTITSFPHNESFESNISWLPYSDIYTTTCSSADESWQRRNTNTPSSGTGPTSAQSGSYFVYTEASGSCSNDLYVIESPCYDLTNKSSASIDFYYHMNGTSVGSLHLLISTNNGTSYSSFWSLTGSQGNAWNSVNLDLGTYLGSTVMFKFEGTTGSSWSSDIAIDNITVSASGGSGNLPDLITTNQSTDASSVIAGNSVLANCHVANVGSGNSTATSYLRYYLSTNSTYSTDDVYLAQGIVGAQTAGAVSFQSANVTIPSSTSGGNYYIIYRADYSNTVSESNENNNVSSSAITIVQTCSDGVQNGDEEGIDCGGSSCSPCGGGGGLWLQNGSNIYYSGGNVGIGTANPSDLLSVNGKIKAKEYEATLTGWSDYVFKDDYELMSLHDLEKFINQHDHLPGIPSEKEVLEDGIELADMNAKLLAKIEELTLHVIQLRKELDQIKKEK